MKDNVMKDSSMFTGTEKKKSKKLDYMIYLLAVVSLVLMMVVIFKNNKTTTEILEPEKTSIASSQSSSTVLSKLEESDITPESFIQKNEQAEEALKVMEEKEVVVKEEQLLVEESQDSIETTKVEEKIVQKEDTIKELVKEDTEAFQDKQVKDSYKSDQEEKDASYNWKVLKRYPAKPDSNLKTVSSYKVKSGDSLWKIAQKHNVKTINLVAVNNMANPDYLYPGQIIMISNM